MGNYGLKVWNGSGICTLDYTDKITRLRYSTIASPNVNGSTILSDIADKETLLSSQVILSGTMGDTPYVSHKISRSGTKISWEARNVSGYYSSNSLLLVFLYT